MFLKNGLFVKCFIQTLNNMKHPSSVITMKVLEGFYTTIKFSNYNLLYLLCWLRGKSALPLINEKLKVVNSCVKKYGFKELCTKSSWI